VQQPGRATMGPVTLAAAQRRFQRGPDDRVHEPWRVICRQHLDPHKALSQPRSRSHPGSRDPRRMAQLAAITYHGKRLRQAQRLSAKPPHPGNDCPRDPLQAPRQQLARTDHGQRPAVPPGRPQQFGQVQRVTAAGRIHAAHSSALAAPPAAVRTTALTAFSLNSAGCNTADASARTASSGAPITAGSP